MSSPSLFYLFPASQLWLQPDSNLEISRKWLSRVFECQVPVDQIGM